MTRQLDGGKMKAGIKFDESWRPTTEQLVVRKVSGRDWKRIVGSDLRNALPGEQLFPNQ